MIKLAIEAYKNQNMLSLLTLAMLLITILLPTLPFYFGMATSLALGAGFAGLIIFVGTLLSSRFQQKVLLEIFSLSAILVLLISTHSILVSLYLPFDFYRAIVSFAPFVLVIAGGFSLSCVLQQATSFQVDRGVNICLGILCFLAMLPALGIVVPPPSSFNVNYVKPIFPFTEPSHFALLFIPFYMYSCVSSSRLTRLCLFFLGFAIVLLLENLTLCLGWLLVAFICTRRPVILFSVIPFLAYIARVDLIYYTDRLDFSGNLVNISNLVYVQGWQMVVESLIRSFGFGIGFQQLGLTDLFVPATEKIYSLLGGYSNLLDGGFTFAKLVSEFGVVGLTFCLLLIWASLLSIKTLRIAAKYPNTLSPLLTISHAVLVGYSFELLVRGTGYFSGSAILLVFSLRIILKIRKPCCASWFRNI